MKLRLMGHEDRYAVEQLQLSLFPEEPMEPVDTDFTGDGALSVLERGDTLLTMRTTITYKGKTARGERTLPAAEETVPLRRQKLQQSYYDAALALLPKAPAWGALAGVRPTKLTTKHLLSGGTVESADAMLANTYFISPERRKLCIESSLASQKAAAFLTPADVSLYIGIPFCPTRCAYCSFVSRSIGKRTDLLAPYLEALLREMKVTGRLLAQSGRTIRTVYIGGGTPTTLSADQLARLMDGVRDCFDLSRCLEFTVEGGRPDTLDAEKLQTIRLHGADRMSINPQTMEDSVLHACGRPHTAADVVRSYRQARQAGFTAINMDLIAGLPADTAEGFRSSLDQVAALEPENITVHTLAIKKGADLYENRRGLSTAAQVADMVDYANHTLRAFGYRPYYLYRQKYMSGSFENVGWSRDGKDCLYNIYMMEEMHTIVSLGGGGMNKVNLPDGTLRRFHNPKFPEQYIEMLEDVLAQKAELFDLMKGSD